MNDEYSSYEKPLFMISVAAELAGMHPQTLRVYEQKGLISPGRSRGNTRLYSQADIDRLNFITELTKEGINLAGVIRIMDLMEQQKEAHEETEILQRKIRRLESEVHELRIRQRIHELVPYEEQEPRDAFYRLLEKKLGK